MGGLTHAVPSEPATNVTPVTETKEETSVVTPAPEAAEVPAVSTAEAKPEEKAE